MKPQLPPTTWGTNEVLGGRQQPVATRQVDYGMPPLPGEDRRPIAVPAAPLPVSEPVLIPQGTVQTPEASTDSEQRGSYALGGVSPPVEARPPPMFDPESAEVLTSPMANLHVSPEARTVRPPVQDVLTGQDLGPGPVPSVPFRSYPPVDTRPPVPIQESVVRQPPAPVIASPSIMAGATQEPTMVHPPVSYARSPSAAVGHDLTRGLPCRLVNSIGELPRFIDPEPTEAETGPVLKALPGSCDPRFLALSLGAIPNSASVLQKTHLLIGAIIQPMAEFDPNPLPLVNFGSVNVVRCRRCRSYINPFASFSEGGRRWRCNVCSMSNDVPKGYYSPLDQYGRRTDIARRPELTQGSVEFIAPTDYMTRPPQPATYVFVIDVSRGAIQSGLVKAVAETIRRNLKNLPGDSLTKFGLVTFDSSVQFYNFKPNVSQPQMLVVAELDDVFVPLPAKDLLVNRNECLEGIVSILDSLHEQHKDTSTVECALGAALQGASRVIQHVGGKMVVFCTGLPSIGPARLKNREPAQIGADKERELLQPQVKFYKNFAVECSRTQICVDLFLCPVLKYTDVATLGGLAKHTGGSFSYYPNFSVAHHPSLRSDLQRVMTRTTAFEAVMRTRVSRGLALASFHGHHFVRTGDLLQLPNCDPDKAWGAVFTMQDELIVQNYVSIQTALLYTTSSSQRRIRVHTACYPVSTSPVDIMRSVNADVLCNLWGKIAADRALMERTQDAREQLLNRAVSVFEASAPFVGYATKGAKFAIPYSLQMIPYWVLALLKCPAFRTLGELRSTDVRTYWFSVLYTAPLPLWKTYLAPAFYRINQLASVSVPQTESGEDEEDAVLSVVKRLPLTCEMLNTYGIFMVLNGLDIWIWLGKNAPAAALEDLFGVSEVGPQTHLKLQPIPNKLCQRLYEIIAYHTRGAHRTPPLHIVREGSHQELLFRALLFEDRTESVMSYYEFMGRMNRGR